MVTYRKLTDEEKQGFKRHTEKHGMIPLKGCVVCRLFEKESSEEDTTGWLKAILCNSASSCRSHVGSTHNMSNYYCDSHARELQLIW